MGLGVAVYAGIVVVFIAAWVWAMRALLGYARLFEAHAGRPARDRGELFARQTSPVLEAARRAYLRRFRAFIAIVACDVVAGGAAWNAFVAHSS